MWEKIAVILLGSWDIHLSLMVMILGLVAIYVAGVVNRARAGYRLPTRQGVLFATGIIALVLTLQSPLHHLADTVFFSAHMTQHLLLTLVVPPLLLMGTPEWLLRPVVDRPWVRALGRVKLYPVIAFAGFNLFFAYAHIPAIYDTLFGSDLAHRVTHVVLLLTATISWLPLISPVPDVLPRLSQPAQMLYAFAQSVPGGLVGSLLTLADQVLYRHYAGVPEQLGVSGLADQQLGGLLMWVVGGTFWLVILTIIFFVWADRDQHNVYV
jgi:putative membrane protein